MNGRSILFVVAGVLALAGCQSTGSGSTPPAPAAAAPGPAAASEGDKAATCTARAAAQFSAPAEDVATSNEYPFNNGAAIDGSVTTGGAKQFRCEFDAAGAFVRVTLLPAAWSGEEPLSGPSGQLSPEGEEPRS